MLTKFGQAIREIRIHNGELLYDMAEKLGVSSSYLSKVETGRIEVPYGWPHRIAKLYALSSEEEERLEDLSLINTPIIKNRINLDYDLSGMIDRMSPKDKERIVSIMTSSNR